MTRDEIINSMNVQKQQFDLRDFEVTREPLVEYLDDGGVRVRYAINELFARHGASFPHEDLRRTFGRFPWYRPRQGADFDEVESGFSVIEKANLIALADRRRLLKK